MLMKNLKKPDQEYWLPEIFIMLHIILGMNYLH